MKCINNHTIQARIPTELREEFFTKAREFGGGSEILRELVVAFVENRVTITPSKAKQSLYNLET